MVEALSYDLGCFVCTWFYLWYHESPTPRSRPCCGKLLETNISEPPLVNGWLQSVPYWLRFLPHKNDNIDQRPETLYHLSAQRESSTPLSGGFYILELMQYSIYPCIPSEFMAIFECGIVMRACTILTSIHHIYRLAVICNMEMNFTECWQTKSEQWQSKSNNFSIFLAWMTNKDCWLWPPASIIFPNTQASAVMTQDLLLFFGRSIHAL